jgi:predicted negative regulator of RcsB-dependent stress response
LNIKKPSYDSEKRKNILLNWAEEENCKWIRNKELKDFVLEAIKDEKGLPTPLSIKNFAVATFDVEKEDELREKIEEKSKETEKAFAEEIKNMTDDKILFLSFPFIYKSFKVEFVRVTYQELVKELNLKYAWEFGRIFNWFYEDKINIREKYIEFSHPSYFEALPYLLVEDGYITRINREIFSKVLLKLSEKDEAAEGVASAVAYNFDELPEDVRNLLFKLSEKEEVAWAVALAVAANFGELPENVRNNLLLKLSEKDEAAEGVASAVAYNFDELPEEVRNKLLFKLSEKDEAAEDVASAVAYNFDELPENVRNNLLLKLSEKDEAAEDVASAVAYNFDELPEDVRNKLLFKLSEKDEGAGAVAKAVAYNFD